LTLMYFNEQIKKPESLDDDIPDVKVSKEEMRLAETLIETATTKLDYEKYKDTYTDRVEKLLARKSSHGVKRHRTTSNAEPRGHIINLMDALKRSLRSAQREGPPTKRRGGKLTRRTG
jgi:DNA end-binding protein Ku